METSVTVEISRDEIESLGYVLEDEAWSPYFFLKRIDNQRTARLFYHTGILSIYLIYGEDTDQLDRFDIILSRMEVKSIDEIKFVTGRLCRLKAGCGCSCSSHT